MSQQQRSGGVARIAVGVDGSSSSKEALHWAVRQAGLTGATVEASITWHIPQLTGTEGYAWPPVGGPETTELAKLAEKVRGGGLAGFRLGGLAARSRGRAAPAGGGTGGPDECGDVFGGLAGELG